MRWVRVVALLLLLGSYALAEKPRKSADHPLAVEVARSEAVEAARLGTWPAALVAIDKAISLEPTSADLYLLRAGIHVGNAGVESDAASMYRMRMAANYDHIATELAAAADDWVKYLELQPAAKDRKMLVKAVGEYRALVNVAKAHAETKKRIEAQAAAYAAGTPATCYEGRVLADGLHCCWPGQKWSGTRCSGPCPVGFTLNATNYINMCTPPIVRSARGKSPQCPDHAPSLYVYGPAFWDEDVEAMAAMYERSATAAIPELTKGRVYADHCEFLSGGRGLACCP